MFINDDEYCGKVSDYYTTNPLNKGELPDKSERFIYIDVPSTIKLSDLISNLTTLIHPEKRIGTTDRKAISLSPKIQRSKIESSTN